MVEGTETSGWRREYPLPCSDLDDGPGLQYITLCDAICEWRRTISISVAVFCPTLSVIAAISWSYIFLRPFQYLCVCLTATMPAQSHGLFQHSHPGKPAFYRYYSTTIELSRGRAEIVVLLLDSMSPVGRYGLKPARE